MTDLFANQPVSLEDQIEEVKREIRIRKEVYARHVQIGRMKRENADLHMRRMEAVLETLRAAQCAI